jgi:hypothetical protein
MTDAFARNKLKLLNEYLDAARRLGLALEREGWILTSFKDGRVTPEWEWQEVSMGKTQTITAEEVR